MSLYAINIYTTNGALNSSLVRKTGPIKQRDMNRLLIGPIF